MKKLTFLSIIVLLMATFSVPAQNSDYRWAVGLNWNWVDFHTVHRPVSDQFKYTKWQGYPFPSALTAGRYLNPSFNVLGEFGISKLETKTMSDLGQPLSDSKIWTGDLDLAYKFANGYILKESSWFDPYIYLGFGATNIKDAGTSKNTYLKQVTGVGFNFWVLEKVGLNFQGSYDYLMSPKLNNKKRDDYMHYTLGVKFRLGRVECAENPFGAKVFAYLTGIDLELIGAPGRIRTADTLVRSQVLYPAELRAQAASVAVMTELRNSGS